MKKRKKSRVMHHAVVVHALRSKINWDRFSSFIELEWFPHTWQKILSAMDEFYNRHDDKRDISIRQIEALLSETGDDKIDLRPLGRAGKIGEDVSESSLIRFVKEHLAEDAIVEHQNSGDMNGSISPLIDELEKIERVTSNRTDILDLLNYDPVRRLLLMGERKDPIRTPVRRLTDALCGGLRPSELCTLLAPTDGGKTMFCCCWGAKVLRDGKNVLHLTTETDTDEVASRYDCALMLAGIEWIKENQDRLVQRYHTLSERGGRLLVYDFTTKYPTISDISKSIEDFTHKAGSPPDLVIVDRGDLCKSRRRLNQQRLELDAVWKELRHTSRRYNIPIVASSQVNREGSKSKDAKKEDVAESWGKVTDSDVVIIITGEYTVRNEGYCVLKLAKKKVQGDYWEGFVRMDNVRCDFRPLHRSR